MTTYLIGAVGFAVAIAFGAGGRWIYFHPERFWGKVYGDLDQGPSSNFRLRFVKSFGVLILLAGAFVVTAILLSLFFRLMGISDSDALFWVATLALTGIGALYLLKRPSS
jgi:cobalamin biosynthesis protein CobD/CbiB